MKSRKSTAQRKRSVKKVSEKFSEKAQNDECFDSDSEAESLFLNHLVDLSKERQEAEKAKQVDEYKAKVRTRSRRKQETESKREQEMFSDEYGEPMTILPPPQF